MDAMRRALCFFGSFCLLTAGCMTTRAAAPVAARFQHTSAAAPVAAGVQPAAAADQDLQRLQTRLSELSETIRRTTQTSKLSYYQLEQGDVLVNVAARSKTEER